MIYLATLPPYYRTRKGIKTIVNDYNLACHPPGNGNRAKRRQGILPHDPFRSRSWGLVGMDRAQIARMMWTPV